MKYRIYLRVSTEEQDERTQLDHIMRYLKQKENGDIDYIVYTDKKTSKKPLHKREGGQALLNDLQRGDIVVAIRLDRISRSLLETALLIDRLDKVGAEVLLTDQPGIKNKIMLGIYAGMAEEEVKLLRKRISEKLQSKKARGERYSSKLPYGFALHETKLVPVKKGKEIFMKRGVLIPVHEEQQVLKQMQELREQGYSFGQIAKTLNEQGHKNREEKPFQKMSISRILQRSTASL